MTRRTIPARTEIFCDFCGTTTTGHYKCEGRLIFNVNPACEPYEFDICDECMPAVKSNIFHMFPMRGDKK